MSKAMVLTPGLPKGVYTHFDVSTGHITYQDNLRTKVCEFPLVVYEYAEGYFIHTGDCDAEEELEQELRDHEMSEAFIKVWKQARKYGCWFIRFDADGTEYEEFERFEW